MEVVLFFIVGWMIGYYGVAPFVVPMLNNWIEKRKTKNQK